MLIAIHAAVLLVLVLLGFLFRSGRGAGLIAGYNTMPPEERAKWDEKALCRFMGKLMLALAACWLLVLLSAVLEQIALLASDGMLVKRPIVVDGDTVLVGFRVDEWEKMK